jgi:hypothetical protein
VHQIRVQKIPEARVAYQNSCVGATGTGKKIKNLAQPSNFGDANRLYSAGQIKPRRNTMQFMMLMIPAVYQGGKKVDPGFVPDPKKIEAMTKFNEEMGKAVKIISLNGLHPLATGARVAFGKGKPSVTDGPFIEANEVLGGYWMIEANSKEELVKWAQRCPADPGDVIEIRQVFDAAHFAIRK